MKILIFGGGDIAHGIAKDIPNCTVLAHAECDVTSQNQLKSAFLLYDPDVVINCAGVSYVASIKDSNPLDWIEELDTNLYGSYLVSYYAVQHGVKTLIFLASVAGLYGKPNHSGYSASKAGVISLAQSLGMEGYNAYSISPGRVNTEMRQKDYPNERVETRLRVDEIASLVQDILSGKYEAGDNLIIRRIGVETQPIRVDKGEPWRKDLKVGEKPTV